MSNSLIRSYLQPCTNAEQRMKGNQWLSLHQTVDAKKERIFSPDFLIALRRYRDPPLPGFMPPSPCPNFCLPTPAHIPPIFSGTLRPKFWGAWGYEVSCGGHHRLRGKTTTGSALDGAVFDIAQYWPIQYTIWADPNYSWGLAILADSLLFFSVNNILAGLWLNCILFCWNYSLSSGWHIIAA